MDYKELLKKYIKHIESCEGINFVMGNIDMIYEGCPEEFTEEEKQEINKLAPDFE